MDTTRRLLLKAAGSAGLIASAIAAGLLTPVRALADWNSAAFSAIRLTDALAAIGASGATTSLDVVVNAPDIADNSAAVPVEVVTTLANVESIAILAERNPFPLIAHCTLTDFDGTLTIRIKMRETAKVPSSRLAEDATPQPRKSRSPSVAAAGEQVSGQTEKKAWLFA